MPTPSKQSTLQEEAAAAVANANYQLLKDPPLVVASSEAAGDVCDSVLVCDGGDINNDHVAAAAVDPSIADGGASPIPIMPTATASNQPTLKEEAAAAVAYANDQLLKDPSLAVASSEAAGDGVDGDTYNDNFAAAAVDLSIADHGGSSPPPPSSHDPNLKVAIQTASKIKDKPSRDMALLATLKGCRNELEDAEVINSIATERLSAAKEVYDFCAQLLAGYTPLETRLNAKKKGQGSNGSNIAKRIKREAVDETSAAISHCTAMEVTDTAAATPSILPRIKGQVQPEGENVILPTNEIYLPEYFSGGGGMHEDMVASFRDNFYLQLTKGQSNAAMIEDWQPPLNNANLKSRGQLAEWIHIATYWNTGADGLDAGAFRAKHKTWYSRMKPVTYNLGRRTGIHLRQLDVGGYEGRDVKGMTVLCRYNKAGNKSTVYLEVGRLFDALFQIHSLEINHRGRDATKNLADERYANIPDGTVRAFLETCPICMARRGHGPLSVPEQHVNNLPSLGV